MICRCMCRLGSAYPLRSIDGGDRSDRSNKSNRSDRSEKRIKEKKRNGIKSVN